jgi:hypothetical protein
VGVFAGGFVAVELRVVGFTEEEAEEIEFPVVVETCEPLLNVGPHSSPSNSLDKGINETK